MPKTKFICEYCGKEFERWASKYPNGIAKYCSLKCNGASKKDKETENRKLIHCDNCNKEYLVYKWQYDSHKNHFCSYKCHDEYREKKIVSKCENCGKEFLVKISINKLGYGRFCSWECRSTFLKGKNHFCFKSEKKICPICGKEFYPRPYFVNNGGGIYCSLECKYKSQELERPQDSKEFYETAFWKRLKKECLIRDNYTCQQCGIKGGNELHAHHIHPRTFGGDDKIENLVTLCSSCHMKIEHKTRKKLDIKLYKRAE